ncbi:MAG: hypothetical protein RIE24_04305 [Silicimonas sp.]
MTYKISDDVLPLLKPKRLVAARDILARPDLVPDLPGIYGWWFDGALARVPRDGAVRCGGFDLLYVGIAPRPPGRAGRSSKSTLRRRLVRNHLRGRLSGSTLRRTLAALLGEELALSVRRGPASRPVMARADEDRLTAWIAGHGALSWVPTPAPWDPESELLRAGPALPLNVKGTSHPFSQTLRAARADLGVLSQPANANARVVAGAG